jgi:hypothetical protein
MMKRSYFYLQVYRVRAAIRLINYTDSCGFFKKGKNIELYAASALYITLRFKKVSIFYDLGTLSFDRL